MATFGPLLYFVSIYLQNVLGYDALRTGLGFIAASMTSPMSWWVIRRGSETPCCSTVIALASAIPIHAGSSRWSPLLHATAAPVAARRIPRRLP
jgi:hypothetical protein